MKSLVNAILDFIYPPTCSFCQARLLVQEQVICDPCRDSILTQDDWRCPFCGATGQGEVPARGEPCQFCPPSGADWQGALAATHYYAATAHCVHAFKYQRRMEVGRAMADILVARLAEPILALDNRIGWVVPIPLHWTRQGWRGFNQSQILAERLADAIELPYVDALKRIRRTKMQTRIPKERRAENVRGAFALRNRHGSDLPRILLVDDVLTTGHTVQECARVLKLAGAPQVWVACFARAAATAPEPLPAPENASPSGAASDVR